jgi:hypothetical protein
VSAFSVATVVLFCFFEWESLLQQSFIPVLEDISLEQNFFLNGHHMQKLVSGRRQQNDQ